MYTIWIKSYMLPVLKLEHCSISTLLLSPSLSFSLSYNLISQKESEVKDHIITSDEMWCHHYELESKQQSLEW